MTMPCFWRAGLGLALAAAMLAGPARAALASDRAPLPANARIGDYRGIDVMIPMRDGIRLHAEIWRPRAAKGPLPILMQRSPYGFGLDQVRAAFAGEYKELAKDGFIFVLEDVRGKFGSQGHFEMLRPTVPGAPGVDESTDAHDSIDWAVKHVAGNNGRVGVFGVSYLGWTTAMAAVGAHPALKAISIQASPEDMFVGDDFHHNGAFRLDYAWEYAASVGSDGPSRPFSFGTADPYDWFLRQREPLATLDRRTLGRSIPAWQEFVAHPAYDDFHKLRITTAAMPARPEIPDLIVAGWWDQEDFYGPLTIFARQAKHDVDDRTSLVVGPWNHGGWAEPRFDRYGPYALGSDTAAWFRSQAELPFFRHWLKGGTAVAQPKVRVFETGSNRWLGLPAWPLTTGTVRRHLYLHAGGRLSFDPPLASEPGRDGFVSDPADPVPYRSRPIAAVVAKGSTWPVWQADDQREFARRPDVLFWQTPPLDHDVTLRGNIAATLFASTTGTDADWVVKLIDVHPSDAKTDAGVRGRQQLIAADVFRGRFREGLDKPRALTPGAPLRYGIDLHSAAHVFKAGHRIAVQVQSTWFPLIDRNPQVFVPNIFEASPAEFRVQTHEIFHSPGQPSSIDVDLVEARR